MANLANADSKSFEKSEKWSAPYTSYVSESCGSYIRANVAAKSQYRAIVIGYITALNSKLERGGNVFGNSVDIDDYMLLINKYCSDNPTDLFVQSITVTLKKLTPVDSQGYTYSD